jgi:hypothetical protein
MCKIPWAYLFDIIDAKKGKLCLHIDLAVP